MMNRRPMRDVIKPAIADVDAQVFKIRMREWGDGRRAVMMYIKFRTAITQPHDMAAMVGRRSKLSGQRARPALAHFAVDM
jgi:hypothetical protein